MESVMYHRAYVLNEH